MKKYLYILLSAIIFSSHVWAQESPPPSVSTSAALAQATVNVYGGDKFKAMKTLIVRGTTEVSGGPLPQTIPATFVMVLSGEKYRIEINNPFQPFKQIFNGEQTFCSVPGFNLPPINRLGLPLLQRLGDPGFNVSDLPDAQKKRKGFRITSPEGYFTDFVIDEKTGKIKEFEAEYDVNGRKVTTSVEITKTRDVNGIVVPEAYAQRFELANITVYSDFKAKEILVNTEVANDVFVMN